MKRVTTSHHNRQASIQGKKPKEDKQDKITSKDLTLSQIRQNPELITEFVVPWNFFLSLEKH